MKRPILIGLLLLLALSACHKAVETHHVAPLQPIASPELSAIDSLTWELPDSALVLLLPYFDTCRDVYRNVSTTHDRHYAHLLLAELLYKNDYAQTNREELLQAVDYYDSVTAGIRWADTRGADTRGASLQREIFLAARAHYMNGVRGLETDGIVAAGREYIHALETMEEFFEEKDLMGNKAKFMALIYNRLNELFTGQFMMKPAIVCSKGALAFSQITPISSYSVSNAYYRTGISFDNLGEKDSANLYYAKAIEALPDTTNLYYRDITSSMALLSYQMENDATPTLMRLKNMAATTNDRAEMLTRFLTIGYVYFEERKFDSALKYLEPVFENEADDVTKIQSAEYLRIIYDSLGHQGKSEVFIHFLAQHKPLGFDDKAIVSELGDLFQAHLNHKQERIQKIAQERERRNLFRKIGGFAIPILAFVILLVLSLVYIHKKRVVVIQTETQESLEKKEKKHQKELEGYKMLHHKEKEALQEKLHEKEMHLNALTLEIEQQQKEKASKEQSFLNEPICLKIMASVNDLHLTTRSNYSDYPLVRLNEAATVALGEAVSKHFPDFKTKIKSLSSKIDRKDMQMCYLFLLGLEDVQIAILQQCHNSTVFRRKERMRKALGVDEPLSDFVRKLAFRNP